MGLRIKQRDFRVLDEAIPCQATSIRPTVGRMAIYGRRLRMFREDLDTFPLIDVRFISNQLLTRINSSVSFV